MYRQGLFVVNFNSADAKQAGEVVGAFAGNNGGNNGFILQGGVFTHFNAPFSLTATPFGVNDAGEISGLVSGRGRHDDWFPVFGRHFQYHQCD
jgi:hypothetical protein